MSKDSSRDEGRTAMMKNEDNDNISESAEGMAMRTAEMDGGTLE